MLTQSKGNNNEKKQTAHILARSNYALLLFWFCSNRRRPQLAFRSSQPNIPHNMDSFKGELNCPGVLITGQQSEVCKEEHWQRFISQNDIVHEEMPGGHMLPLEHPKELAGKIAEIIASWEKQSGSRSA